jgi:hypothetical protein
MQETPLFDGNVFPTTSLHFPSFSQCNRLMFGTFHQEWKYVVATKQQASEKFGPGGRCGHQYGINIDHRFLS